MTDSIFTQSQLFALVVGATLAVIAGTAVWLLRHTIIQLTRRDDRQDQRMDQMTAENGALTERLVETEKMLLTVLQKHDALQKQVDTGFNRFEKDIDRAFNQLTSAIAGMNSAVAGMNSAVAELRMSISTTPNEFAEVIERLRARLDAEEQA